MGKAIVIVFMLLFQSGFGLAAEPYDLPVRTLRAAPDADSIAVYNIPINVKLLDVSDDGNWYKVKISYNFGPLSYTYVGWARIPVGEILAARLAKVAAATAPEPSK